MSRRSSLLDRRALFASAAAATVLAASGVSAAGVPQPGGRLRVALSGADRSDDWVSGDGLFMQVARQGLVFDTLTEVAADGSLRGELATHWYASEDARYWEFTLRKRVQFHDGTPFTSQDVVLGLSELFGSAATLHAPDALKVQIFLAEPDVGLPFRLSDPGFIIRPAHAPSAGIGTGLYRLQHFAPGQQLLAKRVAQHYKDGDAGWFDEIELVSIPSEPVRAQALAEYMVDAVDLNDPALVAGLPEIRTGPDVKRIEQAFSRDLAQPSTIGAQRPMDNLRAAERWWFG